jgi:hypothetical protein
MGCLPRICLRGKVITDPLPSNGCPSVVETVFTEPLPSNGHMRHNIVARRPIAGKRPQDKKIYKSRC